MGGAAPAKRRDFGKVVALSALAWPGLPDVDDNAGPALTAITRAQRRLDATTSARELSHGVVAHVAMAERMLSRARRSRAGEDIAAALSEAAGFAAWLHADMCDRGTARTYYRLSIDAARHAGNELLTGYMLGSLASFEIDSGDHVNGLALISRAREQLSRTDHPTPYAWLAALESLGHAVAREQGAADRALGRAGEAVYRYRDDAPPPWPWLFPFDGAKLAGYRALVSVRLGRPGEALAAFADSVTAAQPAPKQRAMVMLEVATAGRQEAFQQADAARVDAAFRMAGEALAAGMRYSSERVVERARQFRRGYCGPATPQVRALDRRLEATLP